uniref:Uncharacterized protein n=1 Tax=Heliothis virescens TaxID=7102 RepID=A0A2A4IYT0_HELVI
MKGFVLLLAIVLLAYTYAAPQGEPVNYGTITASQDSAASGVVSNSRFGDGAFSAGGGGKQCGLLQQIVSALWNVC